MSDVKEIELRFFVTESLSIEILNYLLHCNSSENPSYPYEIPHPRWIGSIALRDHDYIYDEVTWEFIISINLRVMETTSQDQDKKKEAAREFSAEFDVFKSLIGI